MAGIESNPTHLDPRYATDANSVRIGALVFDSLLRADENSRLQPELAENWRMIDDQTYSFDLKRNVTFHDGRPLTAADVKYTYESILEPGSQSPKRGLLKFIRAIEATGPYRLIFHLAGPHAPFLEQCTIGIIPAGSLNDSRSSAQAIPPGSGPFAIEKFIPGEKVILKANPAYWGGMPAVAGLVFKIIPDAMVRVLEFKKGSIDFLQNDIEPDMLPWLKTHTAAKIETRPGTTFQYIGIKLDHPVLKHREVRQALAFAIDRNAIIRHLLKGLGTPATGLLSPDHWAYEPSVAKWPYNPQKAKELLDRAGFPDPDGDGPLPRFKLSFKTTTLDLRRRTAEAFKDQLQKVGIDLEVRSYEWGTFYSDIKKGNFHLYSLSWVGVMDPDIFHHLFHSNSVPPQGNNRGRYNDSEIDELTERGRSTLMFSERKRIYSRIQKRLAYDLPYIPLWWTTNVAVINPAIEGFVPYPDGDLISLKRVSFLPHPPRS